MPGLFFELRDRLPQGPPVDYRLLAGPPALCLSLVDLTALEPCPRTDAAEWPQARALLSRDEYCLLLGYTREKRRREWLGGRLAARHALHRLLALEGLSGIGPPWSILPDGAGRPCLHPLPRQEPAPSLSISHSGGLAVAMAGLMPGLGVDLQEVGAQVSRVVERFCDPDEARILARDLGDVAEELRLTMLWSAKEAVKKAMTHDQPPGLKGIRLLAVGHDPVPHMQLGDPLAREVAARLVPLFDGRYCLTFVPAVED